MRLALPAIFALVLGAASTVEAITPPASPVSEKTYRHPDLYIPPSLRALADLPAARAAVLERDAIALGASRDLAFYDERGGRIASLILSEPLVPGDGDGNTLEWPEGRGPGTDAALKQAVWERVRAYVDRHADILRVDSEDLAPPRIGIFEGGALVHVFAPRHVGGVPVRNSSVTAVLNHGNLVLLGLDNWGDLKPAAAARIADEDARAAVARHVAPHVMEGFADDTHFEYVPMVDGGHYGYRLVLVVKAVVRGDQGSWEALVDAATGELIAFEDKNQYAGRSVVGGVFPVSNDQRPPDGLEQAGWPMPFVNVITPGGTVVSTSAGGFGCPSGTASTALVGPYSRINEGCGAINESSAAGDLDLGSGPAPPNVACAVPAGHSPGDTKAARTTYYALARINEQARALLPQNAWLQTSLLAIVNTPNSCGAFWNGTSITLYRENASCGNLGELAGVSIHEWGHGLDANGVNPTISQPADALSDLHAFLYTNSSCIGRGFFRNQVCSGYGDPCLPPVATGCTGLRDVDFERRACGRPHTITYLMSGFPAGHCVDGAARPRCADSGGTPCGRLMWCEGQLVSETAFDLARRDLPGAGFDAHTSLELTTRLFFLGQQVVGSWYTCAVGGGCAATGGYLQVLAADDDDGNLANGTPHMTAIRAAFGRHEIHCATPPPVDSGCAAGPTASPVLTVTPGVESASLSWTPVPNAARYYVYRTDGVTGCSSAKTRIADVTTTSFNDDLLLGGRAYSYMVLPVGTNTSCFGPASNCTGATPTAGPPCTPTADFALGCSPSALTVNQGASGNSTCTIQSQNAFSAAVTMSCTGLPAGATCSYVPPAVTPAPNGAATSALTVAVGSSVPPGTYNFQAQGASGALTHTFGMSVTVTSLSAAPQSLSVDAGGNGVYQPNETVVVAPTWRNTGTQALALTGAFTSHTGPAGPTYTIPDAAASYGTIAAGGNQSCTSTGNCYSVANTVATRPATHWDTTVVETVTPTSTAKTWTLHVGHSFTEVPPTSPFFRFIEMLLHRGVTGGCTQTQYCPSSSTTREQMAVFVILSKEPPGYVPPACVAGSTIFNDVPSSSPFCRWIEELSRRGVVSGCGGGSYCPANPVSRQEMAIFVLKTLDPALVPPACAPPNLYLDVPETSPFCRYIEELTTRGVVSGCGGGNYCPAQAVTREQMGVFLAVTFGLTLYGL